MRNPRRLHARPECNIVASMNTSRRLLLLIALAFPCAPAHADPSDIPEWYGTIRFSKTLARYTTDPPEFQGRPGKKFSDVKVTWSGTIRFLPDRKAVVTAHYTFTRVVDHREDRMNNCSWKDTKTAYHDYEFVKEVTRVAVNRTESNRLAFRIGPDGSYRVSVIVNGGKHVDGATKYHSWREFYDECSKPNLKVIDQKNEGSNGMESLTLSRVAGKAKPDATTLSGSNTDRDDDEGKLTYSWDLTLAKPELVARVQATPATIARGDSVTLDAKASTGKIDKYEWQFTPDGDCQMPREGLTLKLAGPTVTFKALCDFTAELRVSNDKSSDRAWQPVMVEARKGDAWTTKFKTAVGAGFSKRITADLIHAGANRCTPHSGEITNHWLHTTAENTKTWRDTGGYVLAQVTDSGPFKGAWYVLSQSLKVDRQEHVNNDLLKGGPTYSLNVTKGNTRDIDDWGAQVKAHEAAHSQLVKEKLEMLGSDGDPAVRIEKLVGVAGEDAFNTLVDMTVRDVETALQDASSETNVANRLRSESRFAREINIWMPGSSGDFRKQMGPMWKIGD